MKTNHFKKQIGGVLVFLLCAALPVYAGGGGGGGGRGGGGAGGGGGGRGGGGGGAAGGGGAFAGALGGGGGAGGGGGGRAGGTSGNNAFNPNGQFPTAQIYVDPDTHSIIYVADEKTRARIEEMIKILDVPIPQVLIKVVFIEVDDSAALDLGVQGSYSGFANQFSTITSWVTNFASVFTNGAAVLVPTSISPVRSSYTLNNSMGIPGSLPGATGNGGIYTMMGSDFSATLQAVATKGKARVLSRPSILARDQQMAEIVIGQSVYLPSSVSLTSIGSTVGTSTTVPVINGSYQNVGIQLDVTPFIGANNIVQMVLQPQITSLDTSTPGQVIQGGSMLSAAVYAPNLNKRSVNTVVVTPDGQSVVIGGLIANDKASSETKIPLLGDIPILGHLFKFNNYSNKKNELLICLTPHIVKSPLDLPDMVPHEMGQTPLITNAVPRLDLERYLDSLPIKK